MQRWCRTENRCRGGAKEVQDRCKAFAEVMQRCKKGDAEVVQSIAEVVLSRCRGGT